MNHFLAIRKHSGGEFHPNGSIYGGQPLVKSSGFLVLTPSNDILSAPRRPLDVLDMSSSLRATKKAITRLDAGVNNLLVGFLDGPDILLLDIIAHRSKLLIGLKLAGVNG